MKKIIIRILIGFSTILVSLTAWAYFWPSLTDEKELIAPKSFGDFYPSAGSTEGWKRIFSPKSKQFDHAFKVINERIESEEVTGTISDESLDLLNAAHALSQDNFDIPRFTPERESGTDFGKFRNYIQFVALLPSNENRAHYEAALRLSEAYLIRSKTLVDYMMALSALGILQEAGLKSEIYPREWRNALGRAVKAEYYFARASGEVDGRFLFQEIRTWNEMWRYLTFLDECIKNNEVDKMNEKANEVVTAWMCWPYTNLRGKLILGMAFPSIESIYERSLELEQKIHPVEVGND